MHIYYPCEQTRLFEIFEVWIKQKNKVVNICFCEVLLEYVSMQCVFLQKMFQYLAENVTVSNVYFFKKPFETILRQLVD